MRFIRSSSAHAKVKNQDQVRVTSVSFFETTERKERKEVQVPRRSRAFMERAMARYGNSFSDFAALREINYGLDEVGYGYV